MTPALYATIFLTVLALGGFAILWWLYDREYERREEAEKAARRLMRERRDLDHEVMELRHQWRKDHAALLSIRERSDVSNRTRKPQQGEGEMARISSRPDRSVATRPPPDSVSKPHTGDKGAA